MRVKSGIPDGPSPRPPIQQKRSRNMGKVQHFEALERNVGIGNLIRRIRFKGLSEARNSLFFSAQRSQGLPSLVPRRAIQRIGLHGLRKRGDGLFISAQRM